jgi:integration host factor subunit beta
MIETITKKDLVNRISAETSQTKVVVKEVLQRFLEHIIEELGQGNRLEFREFGVFEIKERAARSAQNPRTMEKVSVPAKRVVKFKVGRLMRERVAGETEGPVRLGDDDTSESPAPRRAPGSEAPGGRAARS